jgi:hypothetical protein
VFLKIVEHSPFFIGGGQLRIQFDGSGEIVDLRVRHGAVQTEIIKICGIIPPGRSGDTTHENNN